MKKILIAFTLFGSFSVFSASTIRMEIQNDLYTIPSEAESLDQSLLVLSSSALEKICYTGNEDEAKRLLDNTVIYATNVKKYSSFTYKKFLSVDITIFNQNTREKQLSRFVILPCNDKKWWN